jgi:hypothetical protein
MTNSGRQHPEAKPQKMRGFQQSGSKIRKIKNHEDSHRFRENIRATGGKISVNARGE